LRNLDEEYQIAVYKSVRQAAAKLGISVVCVQGALEDRIPANTLLSGGMDTAFFPPDVIGVDGVLLLSSVIVDYTHLDAGTVDPEAPPQTSTFPLVSVGSYLPQVPSVIVDSKKAMEQIITHIVNVHGARKILYIGGQINTLDDRVRAAAFSDACAGKGFAADFPPIQGSAAHGEFHETSGMMVMRDYIASHENDVLDAVIAANDSMAIGAHKILQEHPLWKKCAVTGFDDTPSSRLEIPALTTVRQPFELFGEAAVRTLSDVIAGKETAALATFDAEPCIRRSCGCRYEAAEMVTGTAEMRDELNQQSRYTHHLSTFGQQLATITTVNELIPHLQFFLTNLAVRSFYLFLNDTPSAHVQYNTRLIFEHSKAESVNVNGNITDLKKFFAAIARRAESVCLYHLRSGTEYLGFIVYDADDTMLAHMCNAAIFIVNTIKRLQVFALESRLKLEAEVLRISELERLRFSMDLHDDICQRLAGISMFARSLTTGLSPESLLPELSEMIDETLQRTRRYAHDSFPMELDTIGLKEAVHSLCRTLSKQSNCRITTTWNAPEQLPLSTAEEINLYRIVQEALQNAVKHSGGDRIHVSVAQADDEGQSPQAKTLVVSVRDNGRGAPVNAESPIPAGKKERGGLGLMSMRFRANQLGADYVFDSNSTGTRVEIRMQVHAGGRNQK
jgi:signal transduction histidine kinase